MSAEAIPSGPVLDENRVIAGGELASMSKLRSAEVVGILAETGAFVCILMAYVQRARISEDDLFAQFGENGPKPRDEFFENVAATPWLFAAAALVVVGTAALLLAARRRR